MNIDRDLFQARGLQRHDFSSLSRTSKFITIAIMMVLSGQAAQATAPDINKANGNNIASFSTAASSDFTLAETSFLPSSSPLRLTAASLTGAPILAVSNLQDDTPDTGPEEPAPLTDPAVPVAAPVTEPVPADIVPPYTDRLRGPDAKPLFNLSQGVSWFIFLLVLIFAALLIGWFIRRLITNSLAVDEAAAGDLFQASEENTYGFDEDEDRAISHLHDDDQEVEPLSGFDEQDDHIQDPVEKRGFMSRLFGGSVARDHDSENNTLFNSNEFNDDENDGVIDVEPESIEFDAAKEGTPPHEPAQEIETVSFEPDPTPQTFHVAPHTLSTPEPVTENLPDELEETLKNLDIKHSENSQSINNLEQQLVSHHESIHNELTTIRDEAMTHRTHLDETMETRFAAISNSVETGLSKTERLAKEKLAQANNMNTGEFETIISKLDKKINDQSRVSDVNFNRVLQKLDNLGTPAPQLSRLANDTSELKTQIAALQRLTREPAPAPIPLVNAEETKAREQNTQILRNLETALGEQSRSLHAFREENRVLSRKFDALNDRIDRMESEMQNQRSSLVEVIERYNTTPIIPTPPPVETHAPTMYETSEHTQRADALGIMGAVPASLPDAYQPEPYTNGHTTETVSEFTSESTPEPAEEKPDLTPILVSLGGLEQSATNKEEAPSISPLSPAASETPSKISNPDSGATDERTIRPLTFNFSNNDKSLTDR